MEPTLQQKAPWKARKTALVVIAPQGEDDPWHTTDLHYEHLAGLLSGPGGLDVHFVNQAAYFSRENISRYDLVILWTIHNQKADWALKNIFAAVEQGTPLLSLHGGLWATGVSYGDEGRDAIGCRLFELHHYVHQKFTVHFSGKHEALFPELTDFEIEDEPYMIDLLDKDAQVLAYYLPAKINDRPDDPDHLANRWCKEHVKAPLIYTRTLGKGRILVNGMGHDERALSNPSYRKIVQQSIRYLLEEKK